MRRNKTFVVVVLQLFMLSVGGHAANPNTKPLSGLNTADFEKNKDEDVEWQHNPFVRQKGDRGVSNLDLLAIVYRSDDAAALINGQVVRVGDSVGSAKVVSIVKDHVVMRNENGIFKLSFKGKTK